MPPKGRKTAARKLASVSHLVSRPLSVSEGAFLDYAAGGFMNATHAYAASGYKSSGKAAVTRTFQRLACANVAATADAERVKIAKRLDVTKERVLEDVAAVAFYGAGDFVLPDPERPGEVTDIKSSETSGSCRRACVSASLAGATTVPAGLILKLADKQGNVELLGRSVGMWVDKKEVRVGELALATYAEVDAAIENAARQVAEAEGVPVDSVLDQIRRRTRQLMLAPPAAPRSLIDVRRRGKSPRHVSAGSTGARPAGAMEPPQVLPAARKAA